MFPEPGPLAYVISDTSGNGSGPAAFVRVQTHCQQKVGKAVRIEEFFQETQPLLLVRASYSFMPPGPKLKSPA